MFKVVLVRFLIKSMYFIFKFIVCCLKCVSMFEKDEVMIWLVLVVMVIVGGMFMKNKSGVIKKLLFMLNILESIFIMLFNFSSRKVFIEILVMGR